MSGIGTGYDLSTTTFSPDGRVFQVEYCAKAVENSGSALGVRCKDGVVLAVEKIVQSKMLVHGSLRRCHIVDTHATLSVAGLSADGRVIVDRARDEAASYRTSYNTPIPGHVLAERLAAFVHMYSLYWPVRPFGCAVMLGVYGESEKADDENEKDTPQLYVIEPSGMVYRYRAFALGKGKQAGKTELEKLNFETLTCREAVGALAKVIVVNCREDGKDKLWELEMSWVCEESKGKAMMVPRELVNEAFDAAKRAQQDDDEDDDDDDDDAMDQDDA
mmetsp:Transcript_14712/g.31535  ORF Transcript_14712/g.31535 Transcript_14712/m.31535 type:complete len:275 (+) Transcript_14712:114-938(+)|eukprot:CAMPEP_0185857386 /NCGR_PEP_ID=MMETSP1354-20130828/29481_1 /TAXON_ID=708628 /ORGANISM="Erythrolobus madagascarensis, Strain CCMP3276" /LENGTH=274 /DNA_ID=CAMNT_0028559657 /DNA_START=443 /DNA_END=1267 /DNA_ORIENTATION=-